MNKYIRVYNLSSVSLEVTLSCSMKGESSCWIITRAKDFFDETTGVVRIHKEDKCQKMFISLGTFVKDMHNNLVFKIFSKQQLIDYSSKPIYN